MLFLDKQVYLKQDQLEINDKYLIPTTFPRLSFVFCDVIYLFVYCASPLIRCIGPWPTQLYVGAVTLHVTKEKKATKPIGYALLRGEIYSIPLLTMPLSSYYTIRFWPMTTRL